MLDINKKKTKQQQQQKPRINGVFNTLRYNFSTSQISKINRDLINFSLAKAIAVEVLIFCKARSI